MPNNKNLLSPDLGAGDEGPTTAYERTQYELVFLAAIVKLSPNQLANALDGLSEEQRGRLDFAFGSEETHATGDLMERLKNSVYYRPPTETNNG